MNEALVHIFKEVHIKTDVLAPNAPDNAVLNLIPS